MHIQSCRVFVLLLGLCSATAWAQTATFNVDAAGKISAADPTLASSKALKAKTPLALSVQCDDKGCKEVSVTVDGAKIAGVSTDSTATFAIQKAQVRTSPASIVVSRNANEKFNFMFTSEGDSGDTGGGGRGGGGDSQLSLDKEYSKCTAIPDNAQLDAATTNATAAGEAQSQRRIDGLNSLFNGFKPRIAVFIVTPVGSVLQRPANIDEGQTVAVVVYASQTIIGDLVVKRTSTLRTPDVFRAVGAETDISKLQLHARVEGEPEQCTFRTWVLGDDFAPGAGTFEIRSFAAQKSISTFEFGVDALYSGIYSMGAMRTDAIDPDFYLSSDGTTQTIRQRNLGDNDVLYTVMYTPYVWGKRSLQAKPRLWERFNPTIGLVLDNVSENFVAGVSFDFPVGGLVLTYGKHWRRVSRLDPSANVAVGDPFTGTIEQLPVGNEWNDETFISLTIDLRAAVTLFQKALRSN
jgi:hypothetical protein